MAEPQPSPSTSKNEGSEASPPVTETPAAEQLPQEPSGGGGGEGETTPPEPQPHAPQQGPPVEPQLSPSTSKHEGGEAAISSPPVTDTPAAEQLPQEPSGDGEGEGKTTPPEPQPHAPQHGDSESTSVTTPPDPTPPHIYQESWSTLSRDVLIDKIKGVIFGQAIGDALGLATEFMSREQAISYYGKKGPSKYSEIVQDFHRTRWEHGDWTDDTDQMLLILQMIVEGEGKVDRCVFAKKMRHWMHNGFKELGDMGGMGIGMTVSQTLRHRSFLEHPHEAAEEVWERSGRYLAANGAIMRTSILGVLEFNRLDRVVANTREVCLTTHADPRCLASCIAVTTAISLMLQGAHDPKTKEGVEALTEASLQQATNVLDHDDQKRELEQHMKSQKLKYLKLDDKHTIGYTFKALGAGFYGLRHAKDFRDTIREVIMQAGDADSNGAVCGALMGCKFGYSGLPQDLLTFPNREWLDEQVTRFLDTIGLCAQTD